MLEYILQLTIFFFIKVVHRSLNQKSYWHERILEFPLTTHRRYLESIWNVRQEIPCPEGLSVPSKKYFNSFSRDRRVRKRRNKEARMALYIIIYGSQLLSPSARH